MSHIVYVTGAAENDLKEIMPWYEKQKAGLGEHFIISFESCLASIERNPQQFQSWYHGFRRANFSRFPYAVYYKILSDKVEVRGVFHQRRSIYKELRKRK